MLLRQPALWRPPAAAAGIVLGTATKVASSAGLVASLSGSYTVPVGTTTLLCVVLARCVAGGGVFGTNGGSATYDGNALTFRGCFGQADTSATVLWIGSLAAPTTGASLTLAFTIANSPSTNIRAGMLVAVPATGVTGFGTIQGSFVNAAGATSTSTSVTTTAADSKVFGGLTVAQSTSGPFTPGTDVDELFDDSQTADITSEGCIGFVGKMDAAAIQAYTFAASWGASIGRRTVGALELLA